VVVVNDNTGKIVSDKTETEDELESKKKKKPCMAMTGVTKTGITTECTDTPKKSRSNTAKERIYDRAK
jgi:hypothetical protein